MGLIGSAWAKNLIADGHTVRCWNRTPKNLPNFTPSIQEAVDGAEVIFIIVYDPPAVQSVLNQIQSKLGPGQLVIQSSTISAKWTQIFAENVRKTGAWFLEAPFTGSKIAAEQRQTVFYLGGDLEIVEKARPILKPLSGAILHIGPLGSASTMKLAMNLNIAGIGQTLCESLTLCRQAGIPDDIYFSALMPNASRSGFSDLKGPKLRQHDYSAQFSHIRIMICLAVCPGLRRYQRRACSRRWVMIRIATAARKCCKQSRGLRRYPINRASSTKSAFGGRATSSCAIPFISGPIVFAKPAPGARPTIRRNATRA